VLAPGAVVTQVDRQFDVSTSLIYEWRRNAQQSGAMFVPAVIAEDEDHVAGDVSTADGSGDPARSSRRDDGEHFGDGARAVGTDGVAGTAMIPVRSDVRVWLTSGHTDMRKGMGGLALLIQEGLGRDPFAGGRVRVSGAQWVADQGPLA
jgi:hypothetical protein